MKSVYLTSGVEEPSKWSAGFVWANIAHVGNGKSVETVQLPTGSKIDDAISEVMKVAQERGFEIISK